MLPEGEPLTTARVRFSQEVGEMLDVPAVTICTIPEALEQVSPTLASLRDDRPEVTAIAGFSELIALRVLAGMRELGLEAPGDWAVIGFDESEYAEMFTPKLTTLTADAEGHGRLAARRALGLDTSDVKTKIGRVIPRESA